MNDSKFMVKIACAALEDKKAEDIRVIKIDEIGRGHSLPICQDNF